MTKHDAVTAFFQPKAEELAGQYLEFNYSDDYSGISLVTNYSDKLLKKYLESAEKRTPFKCTAPFPRAAKKSARLVILLEPGTAISKFIG